MRILLVSPVGSNPNAGASRVYHLLTNGLRARGHTVRCLHREDIAIPNYLRFVASRWMQPQFASKAAFRALAEPYDVVMCPSGMLYPLYEKQRQLSKRPLLVQQYHGLGLFDHQALVTEELRGHNKPSLVYRLLNSRFPSFWDAKGFEYADMAVVQCDRDIDFLEEKTSIPVTKISLALHPSILEAGKAAQTSERDPFTLIWFGSWSVRKGRHYLISAFRKVTAKFPEATLLIGGTGMGDELKDQFDPHLRRQITVLPRISVEEQIAILRKSTVFLFPSISEGFGFALLEAMGMGVACVTTSTGLGGDLPFDKELALVIPPASSLHLANAAIKLLSDKSLRTRIGANGQQFAREFTLDRMISSYEKVFEEGLAMLSTRRS